MVEVISKERLSYFHLFSSSYIIRYLNHELIRLDNDFSFHWKANLSETASYTDYEGNHPGKIDHVYVSGNRVIVVANVYILAFNLETGELLWKTKFDYKFIDLAINGDEGYVLIDHHYALLDLTSGKILLDKDLGWFDFQGERLQFDGHGRVYHEGLVWCCQLTGGYNFISAIYPETGEVVWQEHVNTPHSLQAPKFHENRMYVLDSGGTLHIYEKE